MNPFHLFRRLVVYLGSLYLEHILDLRDTSLAREILEVSESLPANKLGSTDDYFAKLEKVDALYRRLDEIVERYYSLVFGLNETLDFKGKKFAPVSVPMRYNLMFLLHSLGALYHSLEVHPLVRRRGGVFVRFNNLQQQIHQTFSQLEIHDVV